MTQPIAALIIIGNEVLSGRTQDANLKFIATRLGELGIPLREVRVIPDVPETIIGTVNEIRAAFTYVFTTGGIGPTHDDITSECVARAFGVAWEVHEPSRAVMEADYARRDPPVSMNPARLRMATLPRGAEPILCDRDACEALGVEVITRPVSTVENGLVRHNPGHLAWELVRLHAQRNIRLVGDSLRRTPRNRVEK